MSSEPNNPPTSPESNPDQPPVAAGFTQEQVERFIKHFERNAKRWEVVVYPALFAFVVLAGYGFFLIYSLTTSIATIANGFDPKMTEHMETISSNMEEMTTQMRLISTTVQEMSEKLDSVPTMQEHVGEMKTSMHGMHVSIERMGHAIHGMSANTNQMSHTIGAMNQNVSRPMSFFNAFAPW